MPMETTKFRDLFKGDLFEGEWRWGVFLAVYFLSGISGILFSTLFGDPSSPRDDGPPWYFIRQDFFRGVGSLAGIVLLLIFLAFTWQRYKSSNWVFCAMMCIWMLPGVITGAIIYLRCPQFFEYANAKSYW